MKKVLWLIPLLPLGLFIIAFRPMGSEPGGIHLEKIQKSPQYNISEEKFTNPKDTPLKTGKRTWAEMFMDFYANGEERRPVEKLPEDRTSYKQLAEKSKDARFIWFGHSTILLEIGKKRILIDPVFSDYASPVPVLVKRFQPPVYELNQIKDIDVVIISHDHYDHLDYETISELKKQNIHYIVPLGVGSHLRYWGIKEEKITELDWWENTRFEGLVFTATPSQHFSGRGIANGNSTLWASWAIKGEEQNIFFGGDSGYSEHYKQIGQRLGPFDLTFLENGAYNPEWKFVHQFPEEGVQANIDLKGKVMVPIHWGMFDLALHSWYEPIQRVTREAEKKGVRVIAPILGQFVSTVDKYQQEKWWEPIISRFLQQSGPD